MKRYLRTGVLLIAVVVNNGCNRTQQHEALADEVVQLFQELCSILEGIQNETTAQASVGKLDALNAKFELAYQRYTSLPGISEEENTRIKQRFEGGVKSLEPRLKQAATSTMIKAGKSRATVSTAMDRLFATLDKFSKFDQMQQRKR